MEEHIIYKITNVINEKIYVGQTKQYYGAEKIGAEGRLKRHIANAFNPKSGSGCPKLENAIRKYGKECFVTEVLEKTTQDEIDELEEYYIREYDSTNNTIGYNISLGGKGRKVVYVPEETRQNISKAQDGNDIMNISPYKDEKTGVIIGYRARRREHDRICEKYFTSKKYTLEENHQKALEFIESVKNNKEDKYVKYNKENDLPENIAHVYSKGEEKKIVGYQVSIMKDGKKIHQSFQSATTSLDKLLTDAIKYKTAILNDKEAIKKNYVGCNKADGLPSNIAYIKDRKDKDRVVGYQLCLSYNGKKHRKTFGAANNDLDKVLKEAIQYKEDILAGKIN